MPAGRELALAVLITLRDKASGKLRRLRANMGTISKSANTTAKSISGLQTVLAGAFSVAVIARAGKIAIDMAKLAAESENVEAAFEGVSGSADSMLAAFKEATDGTVSNIELMKNFNLASQLVSKSFAEDLPEALELTRKVAASTGQTMDFMMNSLVRGIGRLSPLILDNLGIQIDLVESYDEFAESIGKSADALSKQEKQMALSNATLKALRINTAAMPEISGSAAVGFQQIEASAANLKVEFGKLLLEMTNFKGGIGGVIESTGGLVAGIRENIKVGREFTETLSLLRDSGFATTEQLIAFKARLSDIQLAFSTGEFTLAEMNEQQQILTESMRSFITESVDVSTVIDRWAIAWLEVASASAIASGEIDRLAITVRQSASAGEDMATGMEKALFAGVGVMERTFAKIKAAFGELWASVFDPKALQSTLRDVNNTIRDNMDTAFDIIKQHQDQEREAQFAFNMDRLLATANFEAEKAALLAVGRTKDAANLETKFQNEAATTRAAHANQKGLLDRNLLVQQVAQARAHVTELRAQDTQIRLTLTNMVNAALDAGLIDTEKQKALLRIVKLGASARLQAEVDFAKDSAAVAAELAKENIGSAEEMVKGIIARLNLQNEAAETALDNLQDNLSQFTDNFLNNIRTTFSGDIGMGDIGKSITRGGKKAEQSAIAAFSDVARGIDTGIAAIKNTLENLEDIEIPAGFDKSLDQVGEIAKRIALAFDTLLRAPLEAGGGRSVGDALDDMRDLLEPLADLFRFINTDLSKVIPQDDDFIKRADAFILQLKAWSGRVHTWMQEINSREGLADAVEDSAKIAESVWKLFSFLGVNLNILPAQAGNWMDSLETHIRRLKAVSGRVFDWMTDILDRDLGRAVKKAGAVAENVKKLFALLGVDLSKITPPGRRDFMEDLETRIRRLMAVSGRINTWMTGIIERDLADTVAAAAVVSKDVKALVDLITIDLEIETTEGDFMAALETKIRRMTAVSGRIFKWMETIITHDLQGTVNAAATVAADVKILLDLFQMDIGANRQKDADFMANVETKIRRMMAVSGRIFKWMETIITRDLDDTVAAAAIVAKDVQTLMEIIGTDLSGVVEPEAGDFMKTIETHIRRLMAVSGRIHDWMVDIIDDEMDKSVEAAADVAQNVQKLFGLIGVDLLKVIPSPGRFTELATRFIDQLGILQEQITTWITGMDEATKQNIENAVPIAENIEALFGILGVDLADIVPVSDAGFSDKVDKYLEQVLEAVTAAAIKIDALSDETKNALPGAMVVATQAAAVFSGLAGVASAINDAIDEGGIDLNSARSIIEQFSRLLQPGGIVHFPDIDQIEQPGSPIIGVPIVEHQWHITLVLPQLDATIERLITEKYNVAERRFAPVRVLLGVDG